MLILKSGSKTYSSTEIKKTMAQLKIKPASFLTGLKMRYKKDNQKY